MKCIYCNNESDLTVSDIIPYALTGAKLKKRFVCNEHNGFTNDNYENQMIKQLDVFRNRLGLTERDGDPVRYKGELSIGEYTFPNISISDHASIMNNSKRVFRTTDENGKKILVGDRSKLLKIKGATDDKIKDIPASDFSVVSHTNIQNLFISSATLHAITKIAYEWHCYINDIESFDSQKYSDIVSYVLNPESEEHGVVFTSTNATTVANDVYTILLGGTEMAQVTQMIVSEGNYEKSTLINAKSKQTSEETNLLDFFADGFNSLRSSCYQGYMIEHPVKSDSELLVNMSYKRKLPGKNKLIQEETRFIRMAIRKTDKNQVSIDIRQPSSFDTQKALDILKKIVGDSDDTGVYLSHLNLDLLTDKNKVAFFDKLSTISFSNWRLKTVTGITVRKSSITDDDDIDSEISDDEGATGTLAGINQAVLNGSGLRSNEFVQKSLDQGYYISSMKYRYICTQEAGEFIIGISSKNENLRVDMEKSYCDEDGTLYIQPFPKSQQNEIIRLFQKSANDIFYSLITEQKSRSANS